MTLSERLKAFRAQLKLTQKQLAEQIGVSGRGYQGYEDGRSVPGGEAIGRFVKLGLNANWLLTGEGDMLLSKLQSVTYDIGLPKEGLSVRESTTAAYATIKTSEYVAITGGENVHASAGDVIYGKTAQSVGAALMFRKDWIHSELNANPSDLCLVDVKGNSMEPTLRAGDSILIDLRARTPDYEGMYLLKMGQMLLLKNLQALPGAKVQVNSDNPAFEPFTINLSDLGNEIAILGRVVWTGRRL